MEAVLNRLFGDSLGQILKGLVQDIITCPARVDLHKSGMKQRQLGLLLDGFVCHYVDDRRGQRQWISVRVPGDFVDLKVLVCKQQVSNLLSICPVRIALIDIGKLWDALASYPELVRTLWWYSIRDTAIQERWTFRQGRLSSLARTAHFICEMNARLGKVGLSDGTTFSLPLTQSDLAEICGISVVHINRVIKELRTQSLCQVHLGKVKILDPGKLNALAQYDQHYSELPNCMPVDAVNPREF